MSAAGVHDNDFKILFFKFFNSFLSNNHGIRLSIAAIQINLKNSLDA